MCSRPSTTGYDFSREDETCLYALGNSTACSNSLQCASGYSGRVTVELCTSEGKYSVAGCSAVTEESIVEESTEKLRGLMMTVDSENGVENASAVIDTIKQITAPRHGLYCRNLSL